MDAISIALLVVFLLIGAMFVFKSRLAILLHWVVKLAFPLLLLVGLSAVFLPQVYTSLADATLRTIGAFSTVQNLDKTITPVLNAPGTIVDSIGDFFSGGQGSTGDGSGDSAGALEEGVYPGLVSSLAGVYRIVAVLISIVGMLVVTYLSYTTAGLVEVAHVKGANKELQDRVARLEAQLASAQVQPAGAAGVPMQPLQR